MQFLTELTGWAFVSRYKIINYNFHHFGLYLNLSVFLSDQLQFV